MADRELFEDQETIDQYLAALPHANTDYRPALRAQLAAAPVARRSRMLRLRRPWTTGISLVVAAAVALSLLVVPFGSRQESPLNPRAVLARAVAATTHITPYRATVEISLVGDWPFPLTVARRDLGKVHLVFQSAVRDATHWRVNTHNLDPVLRSDDEVAVANGRTVTWYRSINNRAVWYPLSSPRMGAHFLSEFLNTFPGGQSLSPGQTLRQNLQKLNDPHTGTHARVVGRQTVLGRAADVIEVWPLFRDYPDPATCSPSHPSPSCLRDSIGFGRFRYWIDHNTGVILRARTFGLPDAPNFLYRVTAITFGAGPTAAEFAYRPPTRPAKKNFVGAVGVLYSHPGRGVFTWRAPAGFIAAGPPTDTSGMPYILGQSVNLSNPLVGTDSSYAVYVAVNAPGSGLPDHSYLFIQEQHRVVLPAALRAGTQWHAGACVAYTGRYSDGFHWLALARGHTSLLAVATALNERALVRWAATEVCPLH